MRSNVHGFSRSEGTDEIAPAPLLCPARELAECVNDLCPIVSTC